MPCCFELANILEGPEEELLCCEVAAKHFLLAESDCVGSSPAQQCAFDLMQAASSEVTDQSGDEDANRISL